MNRRENTPQSYYPSSSVAAHHGSAKDMDGGGYWMAPHSVVPVSQYFPDERAHDFVREQDGGPYLSVSAHTGDRRHQGWPSDADTDIELEGLNSTDQPVRQSQASSGQDASPRTTYRQVRQQLGAMRTERLAHRSDGTCLRYPAVITHHRQPIHNPRHDYANIIHHLPQQQQHQDRRFEGVDCGIELTRHDNGQAYQPTNYPGGHVRHLDGGGSAARQYNSNENLWQNIEGDAEDDPEHL